MATVTKPIALDESLNTTEVTPRNIADVLADELSNIASKIQGSGSSVSWNQLQVTGDKIAEITISGVKTDVMSHSIAVSRIQTTGTHIADITIDGVKTELYAPQGSPSFNALIIVTAETGKTVTATKGGDTYTATEVSTGTYEVSVDSAGTWTISDGTLSDTVSVVSQTTYYVTLSSVPDGKTVTPTDDVSIWLQCGQRSENYTTLAEVLADSTCLSALMSDNNAVDYLVRSTTWAGIGLVPTMTSNTTPSGVCSASTEYSANNQAYKTFDGSTESGDYWLPNSNATNNYIQYHFTKPVVVTKMSAVFRVTAGGVSSSTFTIKGSNDGFTSDTHDIDTFTVNRSTTTLQINVDKTISNSTAYQDIRIFCADIIHSAGNYQCCPYVIQFYTGNICADSTAMSYIGLNNYCANTLLADSTWCLAIWSSTYKDSVLNCKVPTMTGYTTPSGVVACSSVYLNDDNNYGGWHLFDGIYTSSNYWVPAQTDNSPWCSYDFGKAVRIIGFGIAVMYKDSQQVYVEGSNDNSTWTVLSDSVSNTQNYTLIDRLMTKDGAINTTSYRYYRVHLISDSPSHYNLNEAQFYGREDV